MAAIDILPIIAPEFAGAANASDVVTLAEQRVGVAFGEVRDQAVAHLAAHMLTTAQRGGSSGPVTSERVGDLAQSYAVQAGGTGLDSTAYGKEFLRLKRENVMAAGNRTAW